ncbi:putative disease resistance protein RGA1 isoform X2 [Triticum aestivum]|uniref:putative disease resistance protein RGA1 isoform X2 n=1 Tax=Triticum aestivum TaxID=4565 RepID=UPI001D025B91|nr:putative disease resistance protein RGA1 isoform X2 [Triticum aestivum]
MASLLIPLLGRVAAKAGDALVAELLRAWGLDKARRKLERHLAAVQCVLLDADAKSRTNPAVRHWVKDLKTAAYQADDVLDGFRYEALRRRAAQIRPSSTAHKMLSYFTVNSPVVFRLSMSKKMKNCLDMIDELVVEMNNFHFLQHADAPSIVHPQTHSHVDELEVVGRQDEKERVVKILLHHSRNNNSDNNVMVLPIVGMGGIGKTTLAQLVHNDQRVVHHFELVLWVCISDKFVIEEIIRSIIEVATMTKCDSTKMEALRKQLGEVLGRRRYLIILDDVWNEDRQKWDDMRSLLCSHAGSGSAIIVTSRSDQVASIMGTLPPRQISLLDEDQSWELFHRNTFGRGVEKQEELILTAKNIVHKCKGLPLAIKTMAALLLSKHHNQWLAVLDSDVWKNGILATGIVPALQLSYDHLSSEEKICFSFCAIFPKDSPMDKDMLIQLWIANDFIASETRGQEIFDVLVWRCFLQLDVDIGENWLSEFRDESIHRTTCKMHDLMHDLADFNLHYLKKLCKGPHMLLPCSMRFDICHLIMLKLPEELRYMSSLRHILLAGCHRLERMPQGIGQMNSLHTLTSFVIVSDAGCGIDQLKDLNLGGALSLTELRKVHSPENAKQGNMSAKHNLKRLSLDWASGSSSTHVGYEVDTNAEGILDALHPHKMLEVLLLSNYTGAKFSPWMHNSPLLEHLSELSLSSCPNCKDLPPLWKLPSLGYLSLDGLHSLRSICVGNDDKDNVESCISPPLFFPKLETMIVSNMPKLRRWHQEVAGQVAVVSFPHLKKLHIYGCPMLASMPKMLPLLEDLLVKKARHIPLYHLMNLCVQSNLECRGSIEVKPTVGWLPIGDLHFLKPGDLTLRLRFLTEIVARFEEELNRIPCRFIKKLSIESCGCLFSSEPSQIQRNIWNYFGFIEWLCIKGSNNIVQWPVVEIKNLNSLRALHLIECFNLTGSVPSTISEDEEVLPHRLLELSIVRSGNLVEVPKLPESLETLLIASCPKLVCMPKNLGNMKKLRELSVHVCDALAAFPDGMYGFTALKRLDMQGCPRLEALPEGLLQQLQALEGLRILDCPKLDGALSIGGAYWHLVQAIRHRYVGNSTEYSHSSANWFARL